MKGGKEYSNYSVFAGMTQWEVWRRNLVFHAAQFAATSPSCNQNILFFLKQVAKAVYRCRTVITYIKSTFPLNRQVPSANVY